jgi:hypothetical protein
MSRVKMSEFSTKASIFSKFGGVRNTIEQIEQYQRKMDDPLQAQFQAQQMRTFRKKENLLKALTPKELKNLISIFQCAEKAESVYEMSDPETLHEIAELVRTLSDKAGKKMLDDLVLFNEKLKISDKKLSSYDKMMELLDTASPKSIKKISDMFLETHNTLSEP